MEVNAPKVRSALFVYDGPVEKDSLGNYYSPVINNTVFDRYLAHAEHLTVAIRTRRLADDAEAKRSKKIELTNVTICELPNISSISGQLKNKKTARSILKEELEKCDFAIIRLPGMLPAEAIKIAEQLKKRYLVEVVGCPWDSYWNYGLKGKLLAPFAVHSMKSQVKAAPYVVYVTNSFLQKRYPTNGKSTNCSNVEILAVDNAVLERRLRHIEQNDTTIILGTTAGIDVPYKGQCYVIEALAELKKRGYSNYRYQMVGGGDRSRLQKIIDEFGVGDQVEFLGVMDHDHVFEWLDTIDIYIQPSRQEGLPRALIEAMSRGLPCIGAKTGGIPELLPENRIFSNTSKNIDEICNLLLAFTKEKMISDAKRNHQEAQIYEIGKIRARRDNILRLLIEGEDC